MVGSDGRLSAPLVEAVRVAAGDAHCAVAMGGGSDSSVLLAAALEALGADRVRCVFVDHGLAGSASLLVAVEQLARHLDVGLTVLQGNVTEGANLEERARDVRYSLIEGNLEPGEICLTGHTRDDHVETVLMRLASGAGARGLGGIPRTRGPWRRPFLDFDRSQIRAEADILGLTYADDPANTDPRFTRTRVRQLVMPALESIGGDVRSGIARSAGLLAEDEHFVDEQASWIASVDDLGRQLLPSAVLCTMPHALSSRAIRRALRDMRQGVPGSEADVAAVLGCAATGATQQLSGGLLAVHEGPFVAIGLPVTPPESRSVAIGDSFAWGGETYTISQQTGRGALQTGGRFTLLRVGTHDPKDAGLRTPSSELTFRAVRAGDRIELEHGTTPVLELLRAHRIPASRRAVSPVIIEDGKIVAVVGVRAAARAVPVRGEPVIVVEREVTR